MASPKKEAPPEGEQSKEQTPVEAPKKVHLVRLGVGAVQHHAGHFREGEPVPEELVAELADLVEEA
jgi:hypothetical protein